MDSSHFGSNRRAFLGRTVGALGPLALAHLLEQDRGGASASEPSPGLPTAKARSVICLFQHGGPSQMDLFDRKPMLTKWHGKPHPGQLEVHFDKQAGNVLGSPFAFRPRGESGIELSELLPGISSIADEITLVRSMTTESVDHESALRLIHSGKFQAGRPTWGSWVIYALGTENRNLPAYVVLSDPGGLPVDGVRNWTSGWLPAVYQGTPFRPGGSPVLNLATPSRVPSAAREAQLRLLDTLNRAHLEGHPGNSELEARISNYETAARMQTAVPECLDLASESLATRRMYGLEDPATREYGSRCLLARRLVERGVRFVQVFLSGQPWDTHSKNAETLRGLCRRTDGPSAALVKDLKQRGLLDSTIVLWTGEFGRLPISQGTDGRDHNRHGFSLWLAGGGFKAGYSHGQTDDFGYKSVEDVVTVHDLQATLLHALGLDHRRLTYQHDGRADSLTDPDVTNARVVGELLA
ncbi:DUF1501 domain-containing protein [Aquisphaera insulae]|uniref:DUF1501 domain-containing protein n=1 Tax=Aquisphaera insulae TaxID=2712864 RepID=UPI0013EBCAEA|nr:DUF1501 domain-containing protein [Aquisphaera insulae]